ncbi:MULTISPECIES: hypothetical protein [Mucilaginibacter]|uniref:hypothetical protein n=1 Tax=Mucilaginibacter TaxID=423349 RepID=UPI001663FD9C|nr:hypothetical protein [Mucilaginibacter rubeus]GGA96381.1 hypothetical protein GCM10011500_10240 [Mucilaginibacter rubeus]
MKNKLITIALAAVCVLAACKKEGNDNNGGGTPISDETGAKALFSKMNGLWTAALRPNLSKTVQTYTNTVLNGSSGTATVNGSYAATHASSSTSSTNTSTIDVVVTFKDYESDGLHINGTVHFFDYSNVRSACSSSGCATSSHSSLSYRSHDGANNSFGQANVRFDYNGKSYQDAVLMDIGKSDNFHWSIKVTNRNNQTINTSY